MTFRKDKNRDSSKAEETSQTDDSSKTEGTFQTDAFSSPASQRQGPPGNTDPRLGRVDWDEIEAENIHLGLRGALKDLGIKLDE